MPPEYRSLRAQLLIDGDHYNHLIATKIREAKVSVWISTANLKTMMVEAPIGTRARASGRYISFFENLSDLAKRGVDVCILHASPPSGPLRKMGIGDGIKLRQCPRVHLKMIAIDGRLLYLGSANLTGAGLGAKGDKRRNFELGILTDDESMLDQTQARFDQIWRGAECASCGMRRECPKPIADLLKIRPKAVAKRAATSSGTKPRTRRSPSSSR